MVVRHDNTLVLFQFLYKAKKKQKKDSKAGKLQGKSKSLRVTVGIGEHDLTRKMDQLKKFVGKGADVVSVMKSNRFYCLY